MEAIPGLSSTALIYDPDPAIQHVNRPELEDTRAAANRLGLSFEVIECSGRQFLEEAVSKASRFGAAVLGNSAWHPFELKAIAELAIARKLALVAQADIFPENGVFMSYGANWTTVARAGTPLVKKILQGEKPGDIPVQEPTTFDLVLILRRPRHWAFKFRRSCWHER